MKDEIELEIKKPTTKQKIIGYSKPFIIIGSMVYCIESGNFLFFMFGLMGYGLYLKRELAKSTYNAYKNAIIAQWNVPTVRKLEEEEALKKSFNR